MSRSILPVFLGLAIAVGAVVGIGPGAGPATEVDQAILEGRLLYRVYCVNCHGESGRGDGPTAEVLNVPVPDLTRISHRNGGAFPTEEVYRQIDGRQDTPGHGRRKMPIWGLGFQQLDSDANQEAEVRTRINQLIVYLESIQRGRSRTAK